MTTASSRPSEENDRSAIDDELGPDEWPHPCIPSGERESSDSSKIGRVGESERSVSQLRGSGSKGFRRRGAIAKGERTAR